MTTSNDYNQFLILDGMRKKFFPQIDLASAAITSNKDRKYNCFAWAADVTTAKIQTRWKFLEER